MRLYLSFHTIYDIEMARYATIVKAHASNPRIGHVHKPNVKTQLMGVAVRINSDGLRDREFFLRKNNKYRIIFLGDSITFGWGVKEEDAFKNILEESINRRYPVEILNFGVGNYNTEQEVSFFLERGLKYSPDKVVLFYFINDAEKTPRRSPFWLLGESRLISFYWSKAQSLISRILPGRTYKEYYSGLYKAGAEGWLNAKKAFLELRNTCQENMVQLQVVLLPELHDLSDYPFQKEYNEISSFLGDNGIDCLDLSGFFKGYMDCRKLWVAPDDPHPNKKAHELIADYSLDFIAMRQG
ncbi:MAG: SGNH/GDSL hydrolase family protein [Candidatus Omnitrophota bacterium]